MNLQRKFLVLLGLFGFTVAVGLGVALAFGNLMARELVSPFRGTTTLLLELGQVKRTAGAQTRLLPGPGRDEPGSNNLPTPRDQKGPAESTPKVDPSKLVEARTEYDRLSAEMDVHADELIKDALFSERIGATAARTLREQTASGRELARQYFESGDLGAGIRAGDAHFALHEIIERAEAKVLADASKSLVFGQELQRTHRIVLGSGIVAAMLMIFLGVLLVRRWITQPVEGLRAAAEQIARGNYAHRVKVATSDELGQLGSDVNQMAALVAQMQADAVENARLVSTGEMVRRLAHNIRNPLSGIRGLAELTIKRLPGNDTVREDQTQIVQTVDRFNDWLRDLLEATTPMQVKPAPTEVLPWITGVVDTHQPMARTRGLTLTLEAQHSPVTATFDSRHLEHALVAVITNALQASPADTHVEVTSRAPNPELWEVSVRDHGPGIPNELRERIFRPYFTTKPDGTGIGLAVALQVVKSHGGSIHVESSCEPQNRGTTVSLRLPMNRQPSHVADLNHSGPMMNGRNQPNG
ncbi:MAG: ATP-binding protein [Phycisphaerales bacterium]